MASASAIQLKSWVSVGDAVVCPVLGHIARIAQLWQVARTSGCVDDVIFAHNRPHGYRHVDTAAASDVIASWRAG